MKRILLNKLSLSFIYPFRTLHLHYHFIRSLETFIFIFPSFESISWETCTQLFVLWNPPALYSQAYFCHWMADDTPATLVSFHSFIPSTNRTNTTGRVSRQRATYQEHLNWVQFCYSFLESRGNEGWTWWWLMIQWFVRYMFSFFVASKPSLLFHSLSSLFV